MVGIVDRLVEVVRAGMQPAHGIVALLGEAGHQIRAFILGE